MKRMKALVLAGMLTLTGIVFPLATPAQAAPPCGSWHVIKASAAGLNVKPTASGILHAGGGPDYWNQQFQFCRDNRWAADHYGISSNANGLKWEGCANWPLVTATAADIFNPCQLFEIRRYDAKFWTIKAIGVNWSVNSFVYTAAHENNALLTNRGLTLDGPALFEIMPNNLG